MEILNSWQFLSIMAAIMGSGYNTFNQHYKIKPSILLVWRGLGVALAGSIWLIWYDLPTNVDFYIYAVFLGSCISYLDYRYFDGVNKYGAGPLTRLAPLFIIFSMSIWWAIEPTSFFNLYNDKLRFYIVILSTIGVIASIYSMKKNSVGSDVIKFMIPMYLLFIVFDIFAKKMFATVDANNTFGAVIGYAIIGSFVAGFINLIVFIKRREKSTPILKELASRKVIEAGIIAVFFNLTYMLLRNQGISQSPNPAYVSAVQSLSPVLVTIYNRIINFDDRNNIKAGLFLVLFCTLIAFFGK